MLDQVPDEINSENLFMIDRKGLQDIVNEILQVVFARLVVLVQDFVKPLVVQRINFVFCL